MKFHPAALILTWCLLVANLQFLTPETLLIVAGIVLLFAVLVSARKLLQLLRRTRWIILSLLMIYAYTTPGQPLLDALGTFSPSREGVGDGVLQLLRLLTALAALAILLDRVHRQQFIAGLYTLLAPLQWIGVSRERIAVRLALTLHYAEDAMLRGTRTWQDNLRSLFEQRVESGKQLDLSLYRFGIGDGLLVGIALLMLFGTLR
ncbi:MAG TPA: CbiQ family ECF transporter T component [Gallionella sp.]|nr:CbiQ family ECF transporter T component [Gallionella sp.]